MIIALKGGTIRCSFQTKKKKAILHVSGDISLLILLGNGIRVRDGEEIMVLQGLTQGRLGWHWRLHI